jgi:hypothetical protein
MNLSVIFIFCTICFHLEHIDRNSTFPETGKCKKNNRSGKPAGAAAPEAQNARPLSMAGIALRREPPEKGT